MRSSSYSPFCLIAFVFGSILFRNDQNVHCLCSVPSTHKIDLRSDTVTKPSNDMRTAMFNAEVGDDVFGDDPTVQLLEGRVSQLLQKESALFFPSGTMSNLAATMSWCGARGSEILLGDSSHMFLYEQGGVSQIGGVFPRTLPNAADGTIRLDMIESAIRGDNIHFPVTSLISVENTHNFCGGKILPIEYMSGLSQLAHGRNIPIHLDGARLWNAASALNQPISELVFGADSVSVCLSKGLGAPAGSLLVGSRAFMERARRVRKVLGGGMRQVGVLAAAGLVALDDFEAGMLSRDHERAKSLALALSSTPGFSVVVESVQTNILLVGVDQTFPVDAAGVAAILKEMGVLVLALAPRMLRLVTHRDISDEDVLGAIAAFHSVSDQFLTGDSGLSLLSSHGVASRPHIRDAPSIDLHEVNDEGNNFEGRVIEDGQVVEVAYAKGIKKAELIEENNSQIIDAEFGDTANPTADKEVIYESAVVHGMTVSDRGFCVLLRGLLSGRVLRVLVTPADPMSDGLDRDQAETSEAVTLLQLLQGIDVESYLASDALATKCCMPPATSSGSQGQSTPANERDDCKLMVLKRVTIDEAVTAKSFAGHLCCKIRTRDEMASPIPVTSSVQVADPSIAAMPDGQDYSVSREVEVEAGAIIAPTLSDEQTSDGYSNNLDAIQQSHAHDLEFAQTGTVDTAAYTTAETEGEGLPTGGQPHSISTPSPPPCLLQYPGSDTTSKITQPEHFDAKIFSTNAFEALALALRHSAEISVRSSLLQDQHCSFSLDEVRTYFPKMLEAQPTSSTPTHSSGAMAEGPVSPTGGAVDASGRSSGRGSGGVGSTEGSPMAGTEEYSNSESVAWRVSKFAEDFDPRSSSIRLKLFDGASSP